MIRTALWIECDHDRCPTAAVRLGEGVELDSAVAGAAASAGWWVNTGAYPSRLGGGADHLCPEHAHLAPPLQCICDRPITYGGLDVDCPAHGERPAVAPSERVERSPNHTQENPRCVRPRSRP